MRITAAEFDRFAPNTKKAIRDGIVAHAPSLLFAAGISTPLRIAHFMSQLAHESDGFRTTQEYASGAAYEGRKNLGNTRRGDGKRFRGHGLIQVTGRANHREFTVWCRERHPDCPDFESTPDKLMLFPWALLSAVWYWETRNLSRLADKEDLKGITRKINGGYNGLADRQAWFRKAWDIWGDQEGALYATHGKPAVQSTTVMATAAQTTAAVSTAAAATGQLGDIVATVKDVVPTGSAPSGMTVFIILAVIIVALGAYIAYERYTKSRDFQI